PQDHISRLRPRDERKKRDNGGQPRRHYHTAPVVDEGRVFYPACWDAFHKLGAWRSKRRNRTLRYCEICHEEIDYRPASNPQKYHRSCFLTHVAELHARRGETHRCALPGCDNDVYRQPSP